LIFFSVGVFSFLFLFFSIFKKTLNWFFNDDGPLWIARETLPREMLTDSELGSSDQHVFFCKATTLAISQEMLLFFTFSSVSSIVVLSDGPPRAHIL